MPARAGAARRRKVRPDRRAEAPSRRDGPSFRRPDADTVRSAAGRALRRAGRAYPSQAAFRRALLPVLRGEDPLFRLGGRRMRALLVATPGVTLRVRYTERRDRRPLDRGPVCGASLRPIRNRTLLGDDVTLGYRCTACEYWTHLQRRVPVRYVFLPAGIDGTPVPEAELAPRVAVRVRRSG